MFMIDRKYLYFQVGFHFLEQFDTVMVISVFKCLKEATWKCKQIMKQTKSKPYDWSEVSSDYKLTNKFN